VLAVAKTKPDERGAQVQPIGHDEVERPRIIFEDAAEKAESGGDFVFPSPLRLHIQEHRHPPPDEHGQDHPMIILDSPVRHLALRAPGTAPQVGGCGLVSVEDQDRPVQSFVPLEPRIKTMKETPQPGLVQEGEDPADGVGAGKRSVEKASPERVSLVLFQGVEAAQAGHGHEKRGGEDHVRRNDRTQASVGQRGKKTLDLISTFRISQKPAENRLPLFFLPFQPIPIGGGNLLQESQDLPVALDP
jgi:hypothetical protein